MPSPSQPQEQAQQGPTRAQNAIQLAKYGLAAGAVLGFFSGGIGGALQMAVTLGGVSAVGGAVAGEKINPLIDKLMDKVATLFGRKRGQENAVSQAAVPSQGIISHGAGQEQAINPEFASIATPGYQPVSSVCEKTLHHARSSANQNIATAAEGMDAGEDVASQLPKEIIRKHATPTHPGSMARH